MLKSWVDKVNGYGVLFRFITPAIGVLMTIISTLILSNLSGIRQDLKDLNMSFTNHLSDHKSIEITLEKRLSCIETEIKNFKK